MNTLRKLALAVIFWGLCLASQAITNKMIAISGTNIVLSWPSLGYESYLIQYRTTLDDSTPWYTAL
jgi:hypothetical protein